MEVLDELTNWPEYLQIFVGLLAMVDPLGASAIAASATGDLDVEDRKSVATTAVITLTVVLVAFLFLGEGILDAFSIDLAAFQIAGGIVLLLTALQLVFGRKSDGPEVKDARFVGVVPVGIPALAGPASITSVVVFGQDHPGIAHDIVVAIVIVVVGALTWLVLRASGALQSRTSGVALAGVTRIMGLIVAAIGVDFIVHGLEAHFPGWVE